MNIYDINSLATIPVIIYTNVIYNKNKIILDNKEKVGIYCWTHLDWNKSSFCSSINLGLRLIIYFNPAYISKINRKNMIIKKVLLKHGYSQFKLEIIEYCNSKDLIEREQFFIDMLKPEYNTLKTAYSSLSFKHSKESLVK